MVSQVNRDQPGIQMEPIENDRRFRVYDELEEPEVNDTANNDGCKEFNTFCLILRISVFVVTVIVVIGMNSKSSINSQSSNTYHYTPRRPTYYNDFGDSDNVLRKKIQNRIESTNTATREFGKTVEVDTSCVGIVCDTAAKEILRSLNQTVDPCDNFYEFACQGWQKQNPRPGYTGHWSVFSKARNQATDTIIKRLNEPVTVTDLKPVVHAKQFFQKCQIAGLPSNKTKQNEEMQFIWNKLEEYGGWPILYENGTWNGSRFDWMKTVVALKKELDSTKLLDVSSFQSLEGKVSKNSIFLRSPSAKASALETDSKIVQNVVNAIMAYKNFIANVSRELLIFAGKTDIDEQHLEQRAFEIAMVDLDLLIIDTSETEEKRQLTLDKSRYTVETLQAKLNQNSASPNKIDILKLLGKFYSGTGIHIKRSQLVNVPNFNYLLELNNLISTMEKDVLADYLLFDMVNQMIPLTRIDKFHEYLAIMNKATADTKTDYPRDELCASIVQQKFPVALGYDFVQHNLRSTTTTSKVKTMFNQVNQEFLTLTQSSALTFMDLNLLETKLKITKLCSGYPHWLTHDNRVESEHNGLNTSLGFGRTSFLEDAIIVNKWNADKMLKELAKPGDLDECKWSRFVGTPGAFHRAYTVYAPVGLLQLPFFDAELPRSLNYGRLGSILGHEIAHGLIGKGWSHYSNGMPSKVAQCFINQYNQYKFDSVSGKNLSVDGLLTLDENLSDSAGLLAAYKAYKAGTGNSESHKMTGLEQYTNEQLFFIGFAQNWCETVTEDELESSLTSDVHSPGRFRVLGVLQNSEEFARAWQCKRGSNMIPGKVGKCPVFQKKFSWIFSNP